ncbi:MAG: MFS transporter [Ignavibacteria bacterium]|nr:MFS transporter [Ignavibacteria bacterium]
MNNLPRQKLIILFTIFVDVVCFGIVIPLLPFYLEEFQATPFTITLLFSAFSLFSFLSSPSLGVLSDRVGRRPVIIWGMVVSAIGLFIFASANSLWVLFLGRIVDGLAAGKFTTLQSYMVDISRNDKERTQNLGLAGATFGLGFMIGPMIGGILSNISISFPFWFTGVLALLNALIAFLFLPESHHNKSVKQFSINPIIPLKKAFVDKKLRPLYTTWFLFTFAFVLSQAVFSLFAQKVFHFDSTVTGFLFSFLGGIVLVNQAVLLKRVWLKYFSESKLEYLMMAILSIGFFLMATKINLFFYIGILFLGIGQSVIRVVITSQAAASATPQTKGEVIGVLGSIMSASMAIAPIIAGKLFESEPYYPYLLAALFCLAALFISTKLKFRKTKFEEDLTLPTNEI